MNLACLICRSLGERLALFEFQPCTCQGWEGLGWCSGILVFSAIPKAEEPLLLWSRQTLNILLYVFALVVRFFEWVLLKRWIAAWWLMNGVLTSFVLFLCSWRFLFYITAFFTGLAVLYDVSTPAVPPAVPPASTCKTSRFCCHTCPFWPSHRAFPTISVCILCTTRLSNHRHPGLCLF